MFASRIRVKISDDDAKPSAGLPAQTTQANQTTQENQAPASWDTLCARLKHPDNVAVIFILGFWFFVLDIGVVMVDKSDVHATEYLTNQTWLLCLLAKVLLVVELCKHTDRTGQCECTSLRGWITTTLWLVVGAMQFGVLGGFFLLTYLDSSLLDNMLESQEHTLAEIMIWNHARHVTVCFLHISVTWSLRHYLSANSETEHQCLCNTVTASYHLFGWILVLLPSALGLIHWFIFDDQKLYQYGSASVGSKCQGAFALCALLSALYYVFVPLRSVELERKDPTTLIKAVWHAVPTTEDVMPSDGNLVGLTAKPTLLSTVRPPLVCVRCAGPIAGGC